MIVSLNKQTFKQDVTGFGLVDIKSMIMEIAGTETAQQERLGNPAMMVYADGYVNKKVSDARKKVEVIFGSQLARSAMETVEQVLKAAILKTTNVRTGDLSNIKGKWEWLYIRNGRPYNFVLNDSITFSAGDKLVLKPRDVPYATLVNMMVSKGDKSLSIRSRKTKRNNYTGYRKSTSNMGFFGATTAIIKRMPAFRNFNVVTAFSQNFRVPGEIARVQGSACIVIAPKSRRMGLVSEIVRKP
jgi:hypothetical protein